LSEAQYRQPHRLNHGYQPTTYQLESNIMTFGNRVTDMLFTAPSLESAELDVMAQIEARRERLRIQLHEPRRWFGSLRRQAFARVLRGSNSIEGFDAELDDAAAIAVGEAPIDAPEETRLALEGYRDAMTYVLQLSTEPDFVYSTQLLKSLHFMMTSYKLDDHPGRWRPGAVYVRSSATGDVVYEGADVDQVPSLMTLLINELNSKHDVPAIVTAGMAHLNLVMIHPFRDGNGRMARCLQSLVIARSGVLSPVFMSIEEYLGAGSNTTAYYEVLQRVGGRSWQPDRDARPWLRFVLTAHLRQANTVLRRIRESERLWDDLEKLITARGLSSRALPSLFDAATGYRVRNGTYRFNVEEFEGEPITEATAGRDLKQLVEKGLVVPRGERRGRFYVASPDLAEVWANIVKHRDPEDESDPFSAA
jgi:Fic family protein